MSKAVTAQKKARDVYRFAQNGFAYCGLYSSEDCRKGSEILAKWRGKKYRVAEAVLDVAQPQIKLLRGSEWFLALEKNTTVRSWFCSYN